MGYSDIPSDVEPLEKLAGGGLAKLIARLEEQVIGFLSLDPTVLYRGA